ncbi:hypothetical protein PN478_09495 [Dolichospermum circinale CS-534/05]|uniref:hypothetical protein n=1 Tax=Dolichospermum circinale TaxID=109265 RepID=UPI00232CEE82|nr:hypothetical protein [Dolichospermum circinale]MDB9490755.1 hypothetical protein [Dolichospermum circinale CS-534/05]
MIVNFGKYKGQEVSQLPLDYLAWGAMNLNNKWKNIFHEAYHKKLHPCDCKYRVFRDNLSFTIAFSARLDIYQALILYKREWESSKYVIRELNSEFLIFPVELPSNKKVILDEALDYCDDYYDEGDWMGMYDIH